MDWNMVSATAAVFALLATFGTAIGMFFVTSYQSKENKEGMEKLTIYVDNIKATQWEKIDKIKNEAEEMHSKVLLIEQSNKHALSRSEAEIKFVWREVFEEYAKHQDEKFNVIIESLKEIKQHISRVS